MSFERNRNKNKSKDPYKILGIKKDASKKDIKNAYRKLASEKHPDKGGNSDEFAEINDAYSILSDPIRKLNYDKYGDDIDDDSMNEMIFNLAFQIYMRASEDDPDDIMEEINSIFDNRIIPTIKRKINENIDHQKKIESRLKKIKNAPKNDFITRMLNQLLDQTISEKKSMELELESNQKAKDLLNAYEFEVIKKIDSDNEVRTSDGFNFPIPPNFRSAFSGFSGFNL